MRLGQVSCSIIVQHGERQANRKCCEKSSVHATLAKHALWCKRSEEYGCCEVRFDTGAGESVFLATLADIRDVADLEVHDARAHDGRNDSCCTS